MITERFQGSRSVDAKRLHPDGVLENMKTLYAATLNRYMQGEGSSLELKESARQHVSCYLCSSEKTKPFLKASGFTYVECLECGLVYVNPRLKDGLIEEFYRSDAYNFMFDNMLIKSVDYRLQVIVKRKFDSVARYFGDGKPVALDVGCGIGEFVYISQSQGWNAAGIEFNPRAIEFARRRFGVKVYDQPIELCEFDAEHFDVITLWGVLEHLVQPGKVLENIQRYLKSDGLLVVEVPSFDCLLVEYLRLKPEQADRIIDGWGHLMLFSLPLITRMLKKHRFQVIEACSQGLDVTTILRYMESAGAQNHDFFLNFLGDHKDLLQNYLDSNHHADMIRVFARKTT